MKDDDLTVPVVLGKDFLVTTGINLNFCNTQYTLSATSIYQKETFSFLSSPATDALIALPIPEESLETQLFISWLQMLTIPHIPVTT